MPDISAVRSAEVSVTVMTPPHLNRKTNIKIDGELLLKLIHLLIGEFVGVLGDLEGRMREGMW